MTILDRLLDDARAHVAKCKSETSLSSLGDMPLYELPRRSLVAALRQPGLSIIAEAKRASPSQGVLRDEMNVSDVARQYENAGAAALSILTEPAHFRGSLGDLVTARNACDLPLLRKDFIVDEYQLFEARAFGADGILLIVAGLDPAHLHDLLQATDALDLAALVEVHNLRELDPIDFDLVEILGVNNRDLHTFEVNLEQAGLVFAHVPGGIIRVAESGLKNASDLATARAQGADAVLIGEALMRAESPGEQLRQLRDELDMLLAES